MQTITINTMNQGYKTVVDHVLDNGILMSPRGQKCREVRPYCVRFLKPASSLYTGYSRKMSLRFYAVETLGYLAGLDTQWYAALLCDANPGMQAFLNDTTDTFDGAYGPRLAKSLSGIVDLLVRDPSSRQGVASIWAPGLRAGLQAWTKDTPCTVALSFYNSESEVMSPKLGMTVLMRSNDLNWGFPYDVAAFATIQTAMAGDLGWELGPYDHIASSMHVYMGDPPGPHAPKLDSFGREYWAQEAVGDADAFVIPNPGLPIGELGKLAEIWLARLAEHRRNGKEWAVGLWSDFDPNADDEMFEGPFWDFMLRCLKWRWMKGG